MFHVVALISPVIVTPWLLEILFVTVERQLFPVLEIVQTTKRSLSILDTSLLNVSEYLHVFFAL